MIQFIAGSVLVVFGVLNMCLGVMQMQKEINSSVKEAEGLRFLTISGEWEDRYTLVDFSPLSVRSVDGRAAYVPCFLKEKTQGEDAKIKELER